MNANHLTITGVDATPVVPLTIKLLDDLIEVFKALADPCHHYPGCLTLQRFDRLLDELESVATAQNNRSYDVEFRFAYHPNGRPLVPSKQYVPIHKGYPNV